MRSRCALSFYPGQVHALIIGEIKSRMPMLIGREQKKRELIDNLEETYKFIQKEYSIPAGLSPAEN